MFVTTFASDEGGKIKSKSTKRVEQQGMIVEEALSDEDFHSAEEDNGPAPVQIQEVPEDEFVEGKLIFLNFFFLVNRKVILSTDIGIFRNI